MRITEVDDESDYFNDKLVAGGVLVSPAKTTNPFKDRGVSL